MNLPDEVVSKILNKGRECFDPAIIEKLAAASRTISVINKVESEIKTLKRDYYLALTKLNDKIKQERVLCNHVFKYYADPSGGSDSFSSCLICGHEE